MLKKHAELLASPIKIVLRGISIVIFASYYLIVFVLGFVSRSSFIAYNFSAKR